MPKIIPNIREQLLEETRKQIEEKGYANTTMRSVSGACGFAVGTTYNYFESKEKLVATFVFEDLQQHFDYMEQLPKESPEALFGGIYKSLKEFMEKHSKLFADPDAAKAMRPDFETRRKVFRDKIGDMILPLCESRMVDNSVIVARFIAESLIGIAMDDVDFEIAYSLVIKLII